MITPEQREKRRRYIGSSDAAALVGRDPWRNRGDLFLEKTGKLERDKSSSVADMGNDLESAVLNMFCRRMGFRVSGPGRNGDPPGLIRDIFLERDEIFCANLDGAIIASDAEGIEDIAAPENILCPVDAKTSRLRENWGDSADDMPVNVLIQLQWQMMVIGGHSVTAYAPALFKFFDFDVWSCKRNDELITELRVAGFEFWDYVKAGKRPPNAVPHLESLKRIRREPESIITLGDEAAAAWLELEKAKHQEAFWKTSVEQRKAAVLNLLGDNEAGILPDGSQLTYLLQNSAPSVNHDLFRMRDPELYDEVVKRGQHRTLRHKRALAVKVKKTIQGAC